MGIFEKLKFREVPIYYSDL